MMSIYSKKISESRLLYENEYIVITPKLESISVNGILKIHKDIVLDENSIICGVSGGPFDIKLNHTFDIIYCVNDFKNYEMCTSVVKSVFAFGYRQLLDEVPSNWNVAALIEFPNGMPDILSSCKDESTFLVSSAKLWNKLVLL